MYVLRKVRASRAWCQVTPGKCELTESVTEKKPPIKLGKGEKVR